MKYFIIGGDAAGMSAAMQIVRHDKEAEITVLEEGSTYSYAQCGLPYYIGGLVHDTDDLIARSVETFRTKYNIDARTRTRATEVDTHAKKVTAEDLETGSRCQLSYDKLLIATGARPSMPDWDQPDLDNIVTLKTIPDAKMLHRLLTPSIKKVVIIGGGYIGLEMAEAFSRHELDVRMIQRSSHLGTQIDDDIASCINDEAHKQKIKICLNEEVSGFRGQNNKVSHVLTKDASYEADLVLVATGIIPNTDFLGDAFETFKNGALIVNRYLETSIPDVFAAGDCAVQYHRIKDADDYVPLGTHANKMGRIAGLNMVGSRRKYAGMVGTSVMKFFDITIGRTGLTEQEAREFGFDAVSETVETTDIASYYPTHDWLKVKLISDKASGRLLGGQAVGRSGADKRIDVLATALFSGLTVEEIQDLDLSYAPPYNNVWDPIQKAARRLD